MVNQLVLGGAVVRLNATRYSPAGTPITRFVLEHHSDQIEAGLHRQARCRIAVLACGDALAFAASRLELGAEVTVSGFISRENHREGDARLVLHADRIAPTGVSPAL